MFFQGEGVLFSLSGFQVGFPHTKSTANVHLCKAFLVLENHMVG